MYQYIGQTDKYFLSTRSDIIQLLALNYDFWLYIRLMTLFSY
ncbi:hypothetical protein SBF1_9520003 [Candidatus Desulfosporosinus infrequens]|uniref:Uncharacterized protein n=1 Tax=Candidatus Desulfosporosinus infrequens TaxID=2043169 RepID=A0A2U3LYK4_9FIRM|nr:hypothetical protein SBF1_9520003 [Candidatus Desulfosporosinus infrequens]